MITPMIPSKKMVKSNNYLKLKKLCTRLNLAFTNWIRIGDLFMGLDLKNRKLVIADGVVHVSWRHAIELADLRTISVKKFYNSIKAGELSLRNVAEFIHSIHVQLEFHDGRASIVLPLFRKNNAGIKNIQKVERQLFRWYTLISDIISRSAKSREKVVY